MNIKEIAKLAEVSTATVSRVVNHTGYVKDETREKIEKIIKEHNYVPNAIARSLSTKDSYSVGVIVPDIGNEFFTSVIRGITDEAEKANLNVVLFNTDENQKKEHQYLKIVQSQRLKGLIIAPVSAYNEKTKCELERLDRTGVPVVLVDRSIQDFDMDGVFVDNYNDSYQCVKYLIEEGHTKIAIIAGPSASLPGRERTRGYKDALRDACIEVRDEYFVAGDFKTEKAYQCTKQLLSLDDKPTAIFTSNNKSSIGCLRYLTENNLVLGKDIAVIGYDGVSTLNALAYPFSSIERDEWKQGSEAMKLLLNKINNDTTGKPKTKIIIPSELKLRGSEKKIK